MREWEIGAVENSHGALPYIRFAPILALVGVGLNRIGKQRTTLDLDDYPFFPYVRDTSFACHALAGHLRSLSPVGCPLFVVRGHLAHEPDDFPPARDITRFELGRRQLGQFCSLGNTAQFLHL